MRKYLLIGCSAFVLGAGSMAYLSQTTQAAPTRTAFKQLELFGNVLDTIERQYVTPVDDKKLIEAALDGMLTSLDPHSGYLSPDGFGEMQDQTKGEYGGLGIEITSEDGVVKVISPMDGTPADKAGIKAGDYITAVNGESVLGLSVNDAVKQMRGQAGESVTLTIARDKNDPFDVKLIREVIKPRAAIARMEGEYGYVRLPGFNEKSTEALVAAIQDQAAELAGTRVGSAGHGGQCVPGGQRVVMRLRGEGQRRDRSGRWRAAGCMRRRPTRTVSATMTSTPRRA